MILVDLDDVEGVKNYNELNPLMEYLAKDLERFGANQTSFDYNKFGFEITLERENVEEYWRATKIIKK